ncbi:MAG: ChbG/HpnK family deacetylase [Acetobacteraceae bacterium]|nr:ChbG/HpnK family deacetylase [Acetobacteraceae bacterium]
MRRTVILHADDVGLCDGANQAFLQLARAGAIDCGSVMVPCPWFPGIAREAAADPSLDLGVHLTLTSEWYPYRWGPISTRARGSGLLDEHGFFPRDVPALRLAVDPAAAEAEMQAQIEQALAAGIDATHLDTHMGAALAPELLPATLRLAEKFRLPLLLPRDIASYLGVLRMGTIDPAPYAAASVRSPIDRFAMTPGHAPGEADSAYRRLLDVDEGVTFVSLHPNLDSDIGAITSGHPRQDPRWRIEEAALFASLAPARWLAEAGIARTGMRALRDRLRGR